MSQLTHYVDPLIDESEAKVVLRDLPFRAINQAMIS
jgi:hypothetical protein